MPTNSGWSPADSFSKNIDTIPRTKLLVLVFPNLLLKLIYFLECLPMFWFLVLYLKWVKLIYLDLCSTVVPKQKKAVQTKRYTTTLTIVYGQAPQVSKSHGAKSATVGASEITQNTKRLAVYPCLFVYSRFYTSLLRWSEDFWTHSSTFTLSHRWLSRAC